MKTLSLSKLYKTDYNVKYLDCLKQFWRDEKTFSCLRQPKKQSILVYLNGCSARYTTGGETVIAKSGDVVYAPIGSEYTVTFFDFETDGNTVGINFHLYDETGERIVLSETIQIFKNAGDTSALFEKIELLGSNRNVLPTEYKSLLFQLFTNLANERYKRKTSSVIDKGVEYLNSHYLQTPTVKELADLCFISEVYFRRLFKKRFSQTPVEYRNGLRLDRAKQYLEYGEISVGEIAELLGYATVSHFIKSFKRRFGVSPLSYRKQE